MDWDDEFWLQHFFHDQVMPSVDHCANKSSEMATVTNSIEVFDTYKSRPEDKDSDEESFHLPLLEDDDMESKSQKSLQNSGGGSGSDLLEDDILDKFDSNVINTNIEPIDSALEERLLNGLDDEEGTTENGAGNKADEGDGGVGDTDDIKSKNVEEEGKSNIKEPTTEISGTETADQAIVQEINSVNNGDCVNNDEKTNELNSASEVVKQSETGAPKSADVIDDNAKPNEETDEPSEVLLGKRKEVDDCASPTEVDKSDTRVEKEDEPTTNTNESSGASTEEDIVAESKKTEHTTAMEVGEESTVKVSKAEEIVSNDQESNKDGQTDENSQVVEKNDNEDSEDLFDISVIRDANEDNAENALERAREIAYNETHSEGSDDSDRNSERDDEKEPSEQASEEKTDNLEQDDEMTDNEKLELENDTLDIDETPLKFDQISDAKDKDSEEERNEPVDNGSQMDCNSAEKTKVKLDEITGDLVLTAESNEDSLDSRLLETVSNEASVENERSDKRESLKRTVSDESEEGAAKKARFEDGFNGISDSSNETQSPIKSLGSLADFMRNKDSTKRLTMHDLEQFCMQKICEAIVYKSDLGAVHNQLKQQDQLIETMRKEIVQLTRQARDLEVVNKRLMNDLKTASNSKVVTPLRITRSVGLQVKFTSTTDTVRRRVQGSTPTPSPAQTKVVKAGATQNAISTSPQKQPKVPPLQPVLAPKPAAPILSQALQNSKRVNNAANTSPTLAKINNDVRSFPSPIIRPKSNENAVASKPPGAASVIDLTDEDEKKDRNVKTNASPNRAVAAKNIAVPLRTTPLRVNTSTPGIRLTTTQGAKVGTMTSVVTSNSSAPQVMYVMQSPGQQMLNSKAVVVNFQAANGVITSMNGSMIQNKPTNTIQLKAVAPTSKPITTTSPSGKIVKVQHPAPLPAPPVCRTLTDKSSRVLKPVPPKPHLTIRKTETGIILQWKMPYQLDMYENIASYQLFAYQQTNALPSTEMWRKVGDVKALALPMACTLTQFADKNTYYFAVRPVDVYKRIGMFSDPEEISL